MSGPREDRGREGRRPEAAAAPDANGPAVFANARVRNVSFARENSAFNKAWFAALQTRVLAGEQLAFVNADVPTELFKAMDIPVVVNQWWSAVIAAKQKSPVYFGALSEAGYRGNLCKYCSLALAAELSGDGDLPWGGLPRPAVLVSGNDCGAQHAIFGLWSERFDIPLFRLDRAESQLRPTPGWLDRLRTGADEIFGPDVIDFLADQYAGLIAFLEEHTGKRFDPARLEAVLRLVNAQEDEYRRTRDLISAARPAPLNIADQMPATMIPQWHRGTEWARSRAELFRTETESRIESTEWAAPNERIRLMWLGTGLWYNLGFYEYFEKRYGAVFVWSIYTAIAADAYPTDGDDPLRVLAARMTKIQALLNTPPWNIEWFLQEARRAGIDGVVSLNGGTQDDCRETFGFHALLRDAFAAAGIPVLRLGADNVDARSWDDEAMRARVAAFIEQEILPKQTTGAPSAEQEGTS